MFTNCQLGQTTLRILRAAFSRYVRTSFDKGHLEVERKFALSAQEAVMVPERLLTLGFTYAGTALMTDTFLPGSAEGEMMRVRREQIDEQPPKAILTFKKWVATASGKERQETERQVPSTIASIWVLIGRLLNGTALLTFGKQRQLYDGKLGGSDAVVSIDDVAGLGSFSGFYLEVEVLVPLNGDSEKFKELIFDLVKQIFGESRQDVKKSYRDMLIASTSQ